MLSRHVYFGAAGAGELLEGPIISEGVEHRIEPEQRRSERYVFRERAKAGFEEGNPGSLLLVRWLGFPSRTLGKLRLR
jgi:hypothetical protein